MNARLGTINVFYSHGFLGFWSSPLWAILSSLELPDFQVHCGGDDVSAKALSLFLALYIWPRVSDFPPAVSVIVSFQPAWWIRRHSGCSRDRVPALSWQKGQVPAADFRGLERCISEPQWRIGNLLPAWFVPLLLSPLRLLFGQWIEERRCGF